MNNYLYKNDHGYQVRVIEIKAKDGQFVKGC